ncbi:hypothetical protein A3I18_02830 [Candidatus Campbellbacteria bacterium RIFCSPLOWO2_02_FULL_35_11]|uniref:Baseplate protein J-like domain-containing protein n=1 Tax=Candidatus Campbellbacteria bacterium RIFCSPLOWO2_02_FULL_35_11 TaxID=1797581 RepID=A0A1F5ESS1_9BACT|nr:MAG: hypothetical protein A3I18_02830 [Candidatus Campbellbacteria bacterium RIFCSPLOWO2_02_FULL_35_11]
MSKNILQDVMPPKKRTIRDIPLSDKKNKEVIHAEIPREESVYNLNKSFDGINRGPNNSNTNITEPPVSHDNSDGFESSKETNSGDSSKLKWWLIIIAIVVVAGFVLSAIFSGAKINVFPKQEKMNFNADLKALKSASTTDSVVLGIVFQQISVESETSKTSNNFTEKEVAKKASGEIAIFNEYEATPQRLVINTRFETSNGLIFRIPKSVTVPGKTVDASGKTIPGSIVVTVFADETGEEYNVGLSDFTVPGFKGTDRYSKFYAKSKTPMSGGYSGKMKVVSDDESKVLVEQMKTDLTKELKEKIYAQVPEGFVLYDGGIYLNFEQKDNIDQGDSVKIVEKGVLTAVIFDKNLLSNYIADSVISDTERGNVEIVNIEDLNFEILEKDYVDLSQDEEFDFSMNGEAHFAWVIDEEKLKNDLSGQPKKNVPTIISGYKGINNAEVSLSPFWRRSLPKNIDRIEIKRDLGQ